MGFVQIFPGLVKAQDLSDVVRKGDIVRYTGQHQNFRGGGHGHIVVADEDVAGQLMGFGATSLKPKGGKKRTALSVDLKLYTWPYTKNGTPTLYIYRWAGKK